MPKIDIDMFEVSPKVGDKVKVLGKINHIDEESGEVDVSYDTVSVVNKRKKKDREDSDESDEVEVAMDEEVTTNDQSLDNALMRAFPNTQQKMSCSSNNCSCGCNPCSESSCDASNEPLSSALNNFITAFFGSLTKTCVNNQVVWVLPCDLDTGITGYPRIAGEGLACYFLRVFGVILDEVASVQIESSEIDWSESNSFYKTLSANTAFTFDNITDGRSIVVAVTNTVGSFTASWPAAVQWRFGAEPVLSLGATTDIFTFVSINGTVYGSVVQTFS